MVARISSEAIVCKVDKLTDLFSNHLLDHVLESDDSHGTLGLAWMPGHEHHVLSLLKVVECVKTRCLWASLWQGCERECGYRETVLWIVGDEFLDE